MALDIIPQCPNGYGIVKLYYGVVGEEVESLGAYDAATNEIPTITMVSGEVFHEIKVIKENSEYMDNFAGGKDGGSNSHTLTFEVANQTPAAMVALNKLGCYDLIFIAQDAEGNNWILGNPTLPMRRTTRTFNGGKLGQTEARKSVANFESLGNMYPIPLFTGNLSTLL